MSRHQYANFGKLSDEQLLASLNKSINEDAEKAVSVLLSRFSPLVRAIALRYRAEGVEFDDLVQEGMLGLLSAVHTYKSAAEASFKTYAAVCISNRIISFVRFSLSPRQMPLNNSGELDDNIIDNLHDPVDIVIEMDELDSLKVSLIGKLSVMEKRVIYLYLAGCSYEEIAKKLDSTAKSVDNALQRVRRKLRKI